MSTVSRDLLFVGCSEAVDNACDEKIRRLPILAGFPNIRSRRHPFDIRGIFENAPICIFTHTRPAIAAKLIKTLCRHEKWLLMGKGSIRTHRQRTAPQQVDDSPVHAVTSDFSCYEADEQAEGLEGVCLPHGIRIGTRPPLVDKHRWPLKPAVRGATYIGRKVLVPISVEDGWESFVVKEIEGEHKEFLDIIEGDGDGSEIGVGRLLIEGTVVEKTSNGEGYRVEFAFDGETDAIPAWVVHSACCSEVAPPTPEDVRRSHKANQRYLKRQKAPTGARGSGLELSEEESDYDDSDASLLFCVFEPTSDHVSN